MRGLFGKSQGEVAVDNTTALLGQVTRGDPVQHGWRFSLKGSPRFYDDVVRIIDGWQPAETFDSGIRRTIRWYLDNDEWLRNVASKDYQKWIDLQYAA